MALIEEVDYKDLALKAKEIRNHAQSLNKEFTNAYQSITDLHNSWYGERYNSLAKDFNNLAPTIDEMTRMTVREIPFALETVANNYSQANEHSNATSAQETQESKMNSISIVADVGLRFMTKEVEATKQKVEGNLSKVLSEMDQIQSIYDKITWRSEASEKFASKFKQLKATITEEINTIKSDFSKLMQQAMDDIQKAETSNTVD